MKISTGHGFVNGLFKISVDFILPKLFLLKSVYSNCRLALLQRIWQKRGMLKKSTGTCSIYADRSYFCRVERDVFETLYGIDKKKFNKEACSPFIRTPSFFLRLFTKIIEAKIFQGLCLMKLPPHLRLQIGRFLALLSVFKSLNCLMVFFNWAFEFR